MRDRLKTQKTYLSEEGVIREDPNSRCSQSFRYIQTGIMCLFCRSRIGEADRMISAVGEGRNGLKNMSDGIMVEKMFFYRNQDAEKVKLGASKILNLYMTTF
jgi:hypothetical protein